MQIEPLWKDHLSVKTSFPNVKGGLSSGFWTGPLYLPVYAEQLVHPGAAENNEFYLRVHSCVSLIDLKDKYKLVCR